MSYDKVCPTLDQSDAATIARSRVFDWILISLFPVASAILYAFPTAIKRQMVFHPDQPVLVAVIASPLIHVEASHLYWNLFAYTTLVPLSYTLSWYGNKIKLFRIVMVFGLVGSSVITALVKWILMSSAVSGGLSGLMFVFVGYLPVAAGAYIEAELDLGSQDTTGSGLQLAGLFITILLGYSAFGMSLPVMLLIPLGGALCVVALYIGYATGFECSVPETEIKSALSSPGHAELAFGACCLSLLLPTLLVWPAFGGLTMGIDYSAHLFGYLSGVVLPQLFI